MIPAKYRPRHNPGCACPVCWVNDFHREMTLRNEARADRCRQLLHNPQLAREPEQNSMFIIFDEVSQ